MPSSCASLFVGFVETSRFSPGCCGLGVFSVLMLGGNYFSGGGGGTFQNSGLRQEEEDQHRRDEKKTRSQGGLDGWGNMVCHP